MVFPAGQLRAWAAVAGEGDLGGTVRFFETKGGVLVAAELWGLPEEGVFGFHIHEGPSCDEPGGHYNPTAREHPFHAGDLPPLFSSGGRAWMAVVTDRFRVEEVLNRTVIIHAGADDLHTQPSGNSGAWLGCGVIRGK